MKNILILAMSFIFCMNAFSAPFVFKGQTLCDVTGIEKVGNRIFLSVLSGQYGGASTLNILVSDNGGKAFSTPVLTLSDDLLSVSNGVLWKDGSDVLWLFYTETEGYYDGRGELKAIRCTDPLASVPVWSDPQSLGYGVCTGRPVVAGGRIVLPFALWSRSLISRWPNLYGNMRKNEDRGLHTDIDQYRGAGVYLSDDSGKSWKCCPDVVDVPSKVDARYPDPQLLLQSDGTIMMLLRSNGTGNSYKAFSRDKGLTWSVPEYFIISPDRKMAVESPAQDKLLMARSNAFDQYSYVRSEGLFAYMSEDNGQTWYGNICIDPSSDALSPVMHASGDGNCLVAYNNYVKGCGSVMFASINQKNIDASVSQILQLKPYAVASAELSDIPAKKNNKKWCQQPVKVLTYNIQVSRAGQWDPRGVWAPRFPAVTALVDEYDPDIMCSQEPYRDQMDDLIGYYKDKYNWVGRCTAADSLSMMAAHNPIFYRKDRFELIDWGIEWLTAYPGTTGYDAATPRNMTWAHLKDIPSGKEFFCFSCHYDHKGAEARQMSSYILLDAIKRLSANLPVICCGDFNSSDFSVPYNVLVDSGVLADSYTTCAEPVNGEYTSIPNYRAKGDIPKNKNHIDHIFFTPQNSIILSWELIIDDYNGVYGSDHLPICVEWKFSN